MRVRLSIRAMIAMLCIVVALPVWPAVSPVGAALRPLVEGRNGAISAGDPRATAAGYQILLKGGNAFDAGVAALLAAGVVEQDLFSLGGEGLILVYDRRTNAVTSINGQGWASANATIDWYASRGKSLKGQGLDPAVVPGALHAALTVLERWGSMRFEDVAAPAIQLADEGFVLRPRTAGTIQQSLEFIRKWPDNARTWLRGDGSLHKPGALIRLPDLAATLRKLVDAERAHSSLGRRAAIAAARDRFYKGDVAREMVAFLRQHGTPFQESDFAEFTARIEVPTKTTYRGYTVYKQTFNSQGPVLLQALNILESFDLRQMGRNSAPYLHTLVEAMKLAYADRDTYYADPLFVKVPAAGLLSKDYARARATLINPARAFRGFAAGDPLAFDPTVKAWDYWKANVPESATQPLDVGRTAAAAAVPRVAGVEKDTTHIAVMDRAGNIFDSTPSGGWIDGGVVLGRTGIQLSTRGEQFWLDRSRAQQLRPRSRPRYTLTPSIVMRGNLPLMAIGSPGGDNQDQTIVQTLLHIVEFWPEWYPNLHAAIEWPKVQTLHFYNSFWPHEAGFNRLNVEAGIPDAVYNELGARGHTVSRLRPFGMSGCATVVLRDPATGHFLAGADPRRECYAMAF